MKVGFTTIEVKDLEQSVDFYTNVLSLKEIKRFSPHPSMKMVFLMGEGGGVVQLMSREGQSTEFQSCNQALKAIGLQVNNLKDMVPELKKKGVKFLGELMESPATKIQFIEDPNGVRIELIEGFEL